MFSKNLMTGNYSCMWISDVQIQIRIRIRIQSFLGWIRIRIRIQS